MSTEDVGRNRSVDTGASCRQRCLFARERATRARTAGTASRCSTVAQSKTWKRGRAPILSRERCAELALWAMSALDLKCVTVTGSKRPLAQAPPLQPRPAAPLPAASSCHHALREEECTVTEETVVYHRLLGGEKRIDFALAQGYQTVESVVRLTPSQTQASAVPLSAMACTPRPITRLLCLLVHTQLDEAAMPAQAPPGAARVARWTVQLSARMVDKGETGQGSSEGENVELGQHLQAIRFEVASDPPVVVECPGRGASWQNATFVNLSRTTPFPAASSLDLRISIFPKQPPPHALEQRLTLPQQLQQLLGGARARRRHATAALRTRSPPCRCAGIFPPGSHPLAPPLQYGPAKSNAGLFAIEGVQGFVSSWGLAWAKSKPARSGIS